MKKHIPLCVEVVEHREGNTYQQIIFAGKEFRVFADSCADHKVMQSGKWYLIKVRDLPDNVRKDLTRQGLGDMLV